MSTTMVEPSAPAEEMLPCRAEDPELYFAESPTDVELAKELCLGCPVISECLAGALERREPWGVWGGELFLSGAVIPRKRPRGRPRKDQSASLGSTHHPERDLLGSRPAPTAAFSAA